MTNFPTSILRLNNLSGNSFTINTTSLNLSPNLSEKDFLVLHNGEDKTTHYTKTNTSTISYSGPNVELGTIIQVQRLTPLFPADTTFLALSTAEALTNGLSRLRLRTEELYSLLFFILAQLQANNINLAPSPVVDEAYGSSWNNDKTSAPSRNSVYQRLNQLFTGSNELTGTYDITNGSVLVPTQSNSNSSANAASTAFVNNKLNELLEANNTFSGNNTFTGSNTVSGSLNVPTPANSNNSTSAASTAFVNNKITELKGSDNTFTGSNTFSGSISVPTLSNARNSSNSAASTEFVHNAIYSNTWVVATCNNNPSLATNSWQDLPLNQALVNRGSSFNTSNFIWTCPETGVWKFSIYFCPFASGGTPPTQTESAIFLTDTSNNFIQQIAGNTETKPYGRSIGAIAVSLSANTQYKVRYLINPVGGSGFTYYLRLSSELAPVLIIERIA